MDTTNIRIQINPKCEYESLLFEILALAEVCTLYYIQGVFNYKDTERLISPIFKTPSLVRAIENGISDICCFRGVILSPYNCS